MSGILATIFRHWQPVLAFNAAILAIASLNVLSLEDTWTSRAKLILPNTTTELNADLGTLGDLSGGEGLIFSQQVDSRQILSTIITSDDSVKRVWETDPEYAEYPRLDVYKGLFEVTPDTTSTIIAVSAEGSTPELASQRLEALIASFQKRLNELRKDDETQRTQFIEAELAKAEQELTEAQRNLVAFQQETNLVNSDSQSNQLVAAIQELSITQGNLVAQATAGQAEVQMLSARLGQTPDQAIRSLRLGENQGYQAVLQELSDVEASLVEAQALFTENHPAVQTLLDQRQQLREQQAYYINLAAANVEGVNISIGENYAELIQQLVTVESQTQALRQQAQVIQNQLNQFTSELRRLPAAQARLLELQRQYNIAEGAYNGLVAQLTANKLNAFSTYPSVQVLDQPIADPKPSGPGAKPIALGALLASIFGSAAIILFLEKRNPVLATRDLQEVQLPVLGSIPRLKPTALNIAHHELDSVIEFQRLASTVSMMELPNRSLLITSAASGEGKTTATLGLAVALSTLGFRVLVVDGDFHKAGLSQQLGYSKQRLLESESPVSVRPNLDLLPLFPSDGKIIEFVARGKFEEALNLARATGNYDYVLVDSAPVSLSSETGLMASVLTNVLFVVWPGTSNRYPFRNSIEQLERVKSQIIGLVVNRVAAEPSDGYLYGRKAVHAEL